MRKQIENSADRAARRTATATWWIAIFTIILACVGIGTLYEVVTGGDDTHKLAESTLAASRAWVGVQATGFGFTDDKHYPSARVILEDSGNSPAFAVKGWRCVEFRHDEPSSTNGNIDKSSTGACVPISVGTVGKGVPIVMNASIPVPAPPNFSPDDEGSGVHFYYWGTVTYRIFPDDGKDHVTSFCLQNSGNQLTACPRARLEAN